jgi:hypothetical protein
VDRQQDIIYRIFYRRGRKALREVSIQPLRDVGKKRPISDGITSLRGGHQTRPVLTGAIAALAGRYGDHSR